MPDTPYDPWDRDVIADPYPYYDDLRATGGCVHLADLDIYVLSRYEDVDAALRDPDAFTSSAGVSLTPQDAPSGWIGEDPPTHAATRALAQPVLSKAGVGRHRATVDAAVEALVDEFVEAGGGDVVTRLANRVAVSGVCDLLGVPEAPDAMVAMSEETFVDISAAAPDPDAPQPTPKQLAVGVPISGIIEAQLDRAVTGPPNTMVDAVTLHAGEPAGLIDLDTLGRVVSVVSLIGPGIETTRTMITHAVELAARYPDAWAMVRGGAVSVEAYVNEVLRYEAPIQGFFRGTRRRVEFAGQDLPAGARVLCLFGSANRDPEQFAGAETFAPTRTDSARHLSFGMGIHRCVGQWLALAEGVATVAALAARVEAFEVTSSERRADMAQLRSWDHLEVALRPAGRAPYTSTVCHGSPPGP